MTDVNNMFSSDQGQEETQLVNDSYLETLVGDDKRYKTQEDLAKAALEKDIHIKRLETENSQFRDNLSHSKTVEELLERQTEMFNQRSQEETSQAVSNSELSEAVKPESSNLNSDDISKLVNSELERREATNRELSNLNSVKEALVKEYGNEVGQAWEKAKEANNFTEEQLQSLAKSSSTAAINLVMATSPRQTTVSQTGNLFGKTIDSSKVALNNSNSKPAGTKTYKEWAEIKNKQNGRALDAQQTKQRFADAAALGQSFYD